MKPKGCSILFVNDANQVLLFLRDDVPGIPYPNTWDIPGGNVERDETPDECIVREIKEEIGLGIRTPSLFLVTEFEDRTEYTYWLKTNVDIDEIQLTEGQRLKWFSEAEVERTPLAFQFNAVVNAFFREQPFIDDRLLILKQLTILTVNLMGGCGLLLIAYGYMALWTAHEWEPLEQIATWLAVTLTLIGTTGVAASIYLKQHTRGPDKLSKYVTAPFCIVLVLLVVVYSAVSRSRPPEHVINGFAILAISGGLLRSLPFSEWAKNTWGRQAKGKGTQKKPFDPGPPAV